jgi:hypothetical protein
VFFLLRLRSVIPIVFKVSLSRRLSGKAPSKGKASRHLKICHKVTVVAQNSKTKWQGGRDLAATAQGPDRSGDDLGGGRLQWRRLGEDVSGSGGSDLGSDGSSDGLWEDSSNGGGSVKTNLAATVAGRSSRRGRRWLGPASDDWVTGVVGGDWVQGAVWWLHFICGGLEI